jgi:hypothetical protein
LFPNQTILTQTHGNQSKEIAYVEFYWQKEKENQNSKIRTHVVK